MATSSLDTATEQLSDDGRAPSQNGTDNALMGFLASGERPKLRSTSMPNSSDQRNPRILQITKGSIGRMRGTYPKRRLAPDTSHRLSWSTPNRKIQLRADIDRLSRLPRSSARLEGAVTFTVKEEHRLMKSSRMVDLMAVSRPDTNRGGRWLGGPATTSSRVPDLLSNVVPARARSDEPKR